MLFFFSINGFSTKGRKTLWTVGFYTTSGYIWCIVQLQNFQLHKSYLGNKIQFQVIEPLSTAVCIKFHPHTWEGTWPKEFRITSAKLLPFATDFLKNRLAETFLLIMKRKRHGKIGLKLKFQKGVNNTLWIFRATQVMPMKWNKFYILFSNIWFGVIVIFKCSANNQQRKSTSTQDHLSWFVPHLEFLSSTFSF